MKTAKYALAALGLVALVLPKASWADSLVYDSNGTLHSAVNDAMPITGIFTIDTATGTTNPLNFVDDSFNETPAIFLHGANLSTMTFDLGRADQFLGSSACFDESSSSTFAFNCFNAGENEHRLFPVHRMRKRVFVSGSPTPVATPEPSTLLLLGAGLLGLAGAMRRKLPT